MKLVSITTTFVAGALALAVTTTPSTARAGDRDTRVAQLSPVKRLANGLLQFEAAVRWKDVSKKWHAMRPRWVRTVKTTTSPRVLARMVFALEANMGWPSVQQKWHKIRPGWVRALKNARTARRVARLLVTLETATKWRAVYKWWGKKRKVWLHHMRSI